MDVGTSTDGILAYGYDLGSPDEWKVEGLAAYGELVRPWLPAVDEDGPDFAAAVEAALLATTGFTETDDRTDGYYRRRGEAADQLGVQVETHCSDGSPMYLLVASDRCLTARRGFPKTVDPAWLADTAAADERLAWALGVLGLRPLQERPAWLLASWWG